MGHFGERYASFPCPLKAIIALFYLNLLPFVKNGNEADHGPIGLFPYERDYTWERPALSGESDFFMAVGSELLTGRKVLL